MNLLEKRVINGVLNLIRARQKTPLLREDDLRVHSPAVVAPARLREALFSDYRAVKELKRRWGLIPDSVENWERLWRHNPARRQMQSERPIGWVLESEGKLVGYLGNISLLYRYGGRMLTAVTSSGLVVEPDYRAMTLSLVAAFYRQRSVDLYVATTAIEAVGKIARAFKSDPLPQPDYGTVLFWVLRSYPFAQALMEKLKLGPELSHISGMLASLAVGIDKIARRR